MKPWILLGESPTPDGTRLTLMTRDREHVIFADGRMLMSSRMHGSEEALATMACTRLTQAKAPRVLVGGLGLGYTLRATLNVLPAAATVVVTELVAGVVEWNRGALAPLADHPLDDGRVQVLVEDVATTMRRERNGFDAVLLDVDNGPDAFTSAHNAGLYGTDGLRHAYDALRPGGILAVWSAWDDPKFAQRLQRAGFEVSTHRVRARLAQGGPRHTIVLAARGSVA